MDHVIEVEHLAYRCGAGPFTVISIFVLRNMSCGQRSQVVLELIMAQQPDLLILDDYSIGLDAGYRRLSPGS
jgi:ABC-type Mn2+/Zn2+ transport system ATPase subunit